MKKTVLLSVICIMICFALCACGTNVKVEELNLKGESVSITEAIDFLNEKEKIRKTRRHKSSGILYPVLCLFIQDLRMIL